MKIVNTDNFCRDYLNEWFLNTHFRSRERAELVASALNDEEREHADRYWRVVEDDYELSGGFEP